MFNTARRISRALRNPTVQRILAWVLPIIFGWILSKIDASGSKHKR